MKISRHSFLQFTAGATAVIGLSLAPLPAPAQEWPTRPVTMVVTYAAGSGDDVLARILSARLSEILGQQVIVEDVGGAGGMTGVSRVAKAAPDGYQVVLGNTGTFGANQTLYKNPLYNAATDFAPVALLTEQPLLLVTRKDLPVGNLPEFISYTKANQAHMQFGSGGAGSATHLGCLLLDATIGVNTTHVPYRAAATALQDLIAGRIDYVCPIASTAIAQIEANQMKAIATLSKARSPVLPNLASAQEQGLANFEAYIWDALFLPKGTPAAIVQKWHDAVVATMNTPATQERLRMIGAELVTPERRSSDYLAKFVAGEIEKWAGPIKAAGVSMD
jgi:tripartite-type tricarboxylate transporter receptor subunit TctC